MFDFFFFFFFFLWFFFGSLIAIFVFCAMCFLLLNCGIFKPEVYGLESLKSIKSFSLWKKILLIIAFIFFVGSVLFYYYICNDFCGNTVRDSLKYYFMVPYTVTIFSTTLFFPPGLPMIFGALIFCGASFLLFKFNFKPEILKFKKNSSIKTSFFMFGFYALGIVTKKLICTSLHICSL